MLGKRFQSALVFAAQGHARQNRKGTQVPYLAHLLAVASLVLEAGADEDTAIAALLHDMVEDQGGRWVYEEIRSRYGERVAAMVADCTDSFEIFKPPWRSRKEAYLAHLRQLKDPGARLISLADKVHNARCLVADLKQEGVQTLRRFNGGVEGTLWYYQSLAQIFRLDSPQQLSSELVDLVEQIQNLIETRI